jgi:hypothetical protein
MHRRSEKVDEAVLGDIKTSANQYFVSCVKYHFYFIEVNKILVWPKKKKYP